MFNTDFREFYTYRQVKLWLPNSITICPYSMLILYYISAIEDSSSSFFHTKIISASKYFLNFPFVRNSLNTLLIKNIWVEFSTPLSILSIWFRYFV